MDFAAVTRARAPASKRSMNASSWVGSWWNRASRLTPAAMATSVAYSTVEWPQPTRWPYSSSVYCASWITRSAPRMNAILGGHIDLTDSNLTQKGKVDAGQLKFLAVATEKRLADAPNVPTLKELGVNVVYSVTRGIMVPKNTPADVIAKLESACQKATAEPKFAEDMAKQGTFVRFMDRKAYAEFLKQNDKLNQDLARELGLLKRP